MKTLARLLIKPTTVEKFIALMKDFPKGTKLKELTGPLREFTGSP